MSTSTDTAKRQKFLPIPLALLSLIKGMPVDVYWAYYPGDEPVLLRGQNIEIAEAEFARLLNSGIETVYIPRDQSDLFQQHLQENVHTIVNDQEVSLLQRLTFLNSTGRTMLSEVFHYDNLDRTLNTVSALSKHMTSLISQNEVVVSELLDVLQHDYHTYTHSYNVASYAMLLAKGLGIRDEEELCRISMGGLLHDLGKLRIPSQILTKKTRLSDSDWQAIRRHPTDGFHALASRRELNFDQLMMVYQHHEMLDGTGYPVGVDGNEINVLARICSVVDIFEALTSYRPYRNRNSTQEALEILERLAPKQLDGDMVKCWKALILK